MSARFRSLMRTIAVGAGLVWIVALAVAAAQQPGPNAVAIDNDDIGGVVRSASGPEAGVWVIAETSELPTKFAKIVVTDDAGRYLIPDLPKANYGSQVLGWINTEMFDATHDEVKSQGWTGLILDTNGNGKRDAYVKPNQPIDPAKDKQIDDALYIAAPAPDGSIWGSVLGYPGAIIRVVPGANPTETALAERYELAGRQGLLTARHGRRSQWRRLGRARQRPPCKLRSPQVQGTPKWTEGDRTAVPRRLGVLCAAAAAIQERQGFRQRGRKLFRMGKVRNSRSRQLRRSTRSGKPRRLYP